MNITQRKFTLGRIFDIYCTKFMDISTKDHDLLKIHQKASTVTNAMVVKALAEGAITLSTATLKDEIADKEANLYNLVDLTELSKAAKIRADLQVPKVVEGQRFRIETPQGATSHTRYGHTAYLNTVECIGLAETLLKEFEAACDTIMLGDSKTCLSVISKAEKFKV